MASYSLFPDRKCLLFHLGTSEPWRHQYVNVPDKLHPGLHLPWHQELMTALSQAFSPCMSCVAGVLSSSPTFAFICSFFSLPWSLCILCCFVCCARDCTRAWHCLLCSDHVGLCPIGQGMLRPPSAASLCPWPSMRKKQQSCNLQLCDRTDVCIAFDWTEKHTSISFSLSFLFQLTVFFDCQCCHRIKKVSKATSFLEQLSPD